jgi:Tol biopolymer transport system component
VQRQCFALAMLFTAMTSVLGTQDAQTFSLPDATLIFGDYAELRVVTPRGSQVLRPPADERYNRAYFVNPSIAPAGDALAWGFATRWTGRRARFAVGIYSLEKKNWQRYGDFADVGGVALSASAKRIAVFAEQEEGKPALLMMDVSTGAVANAPYHRGMWRTLSWAPDEESLVTQVERDGTRSVAVLALKTGDLRVLGKGFGPRWSPDGQWIAYYPDFNACAVVRPDGTGFRTVMKAGSGKEFVVGAPVWSPDSKQLLLNVSKNDRALLDVVLLDLGTGRAVTQSRTGLPVYGWASFRE